jgi:cellulose synthase/poly-beta-1,6-N-acetylglucosamine synthase-like glycosyltransferase
VLQDDHPSVSMLVPVWNERRHIAGLVEAFRALPPGSGELVLCAGGEDGSYAEACRYADATIVVLEQKPGEGKQRALARSFGACRGDVLFLTDADARPTAEALAATLAPIFAGEEQATTGTRVPLPAQRSIPLVAYQWALELAGAAGIPSSSPGMLGSNAAVTRAAALRAGGFAWDAPTGTDYVLACRLRAAGIPIRFVPASHMPVGLALNLRDYSRQRARWLRNLVLVGRRFGDWPVVVQGLRPMLIGSVFVLLPFTPGRWRRPALAVWLALLITGWRRRVGYVRAAPAVQRVLPPRRSLLLLLFTVVDFVTWARAAAEAANPAWRGRW